MSVVSKKYAAPDLWNRYSRLAAAHQTIMQLKALIWLPHNKTAFLTCLTQTGLRAPDGKAWSSRSLNLILNDLLAQKLLTDELGCVPTLLHPVSVEAVASSDANCMCQAIGTCFAVKPKSTYYGYREDVDAEAVCCLLRLSIYANDDAGFIAARDLYEKLSTANPSVDLVAGLFAAVPLAPDWLVSRRTAIRLALFDAKVSTFLGTGTPGPDSMAVIARYRAERAGASVPPVLLSYDLVAGHLVGIRNGIAGADGALRRALEGAVAFLEARNGDALQHYRDALKQHRKQLGKRKVFLDGAHGLLFVLALLGANDAGVLAEAQAGLDIMTLVGHLRLGPRTPWTQKASATNIWMAVRPRPTGSAG